MVPALHCMCCWYYVCITNTTIHFHVDNLQQSATASGTQCCTRCCQSCAWGPSLIYQPWFLIIASYLCDIIASYLCDIFFFSSRPCSCAKCLDRSCADLQRLPHSSHLYASPAPPPPPPFAHLPPAAARHGQTCTSIVRSAIPPSKW
jgi:hypothetical protein